MVCIRTSIDPALKRQALFRGLPFAAAGALLILFYGSRGVTPLGAAGLMFALMLIAMGLKPYRKLCHLELFPDELVIEEGHLCFIHRHKTQFAIPLDQIKSLTYNGRIALHTNEGEICFSHFDERGYQQLKSRLENVVQFDEP